MSRPSHDTIRLTAAALFVIAALGTLWGQWSNASATTNTRVFMDAETGEQFEIALTEDMSAFPLVNPHAKKATLWPTELCQSESCGKKGGTRVILNRYLGKTEPTRCPQCGARIRPLNANPAGHQE